MSHRLWKEQRHRLWKEHIHTCIYNTYLCHANNMGSTKCREHKQSDIHYEKRIVSYNYGKLLCGISFKSREQPSSLDKHFSNFSRTEEREIDYSKNCIIMKRALSIWKKSHTYKKSSWNMRKTLHAWKEPTKFEKCPSNMKRILKIWK